MLSGVLLIVVTMFAVLGAYYLSDVLTSCLFRSGREETPTVVVTTARSAQDAALWNNVLNVRSRMPRSAVIVVMPELSEQTEQLEPSLQNVLFATPETLSETVCEQLLVARAAQRPEEEEKA